MEYLIIYFNDGADEDYNKFNCLFRIESFIHKENDMDFDCYRIVDMIDINASKNYDGIDFEYDDELKSYKWIWNRNDDEPDQWSGPHFFDHIGRHMRINFDDNETALLWFKLQ